LKDLFFFQDLFHAHACKVAASNENNLETKKKSKESSQE
jgi:hypothetical protein